MKTAERIRQAMIRVVLRRGYDKTTIQDIAAEAGVVRSTLHTKWKTKEVLFTETLWRESLTYLDQVLGAGHPRYAGHSRVMGLQDMVRRCLLPPRLRLCAYAGLMAR